MTFKPKVGYAERNKPFARMLCSTPTAAEQKLWQALRRDQLGLRFYRQKPLGRFIVDFYCPVAALVIELDGGQHFEDRGMAADAERDALLASQGLQVLRYDNRQVMTEFENVLAAVHLAVQKSPRRSAPTPFAKGGKNKTTEETS